MCGIAGWFGKNLADDAEALTASLRHRGPDGEGLWRDPGGSAVLVHTRLAVLDLSDAGAQPMGCASIAGESARSWLVMNGEIYNFRELRNELEAKGQEFKGHSDTEVVLRLLEREGRAALSRLAGMFALAWYDLDSGKGLLARDPFGIKPLYYVQTPTGVRFSSEVRALRSTMDNPAISPAAVRDTLMWGSVPEPATFVEGIVELPAGSCLAWDGESAKVEQWQSITFGRMSAPADPVAATRTALIESIDRHLVSDVPVGIFLSGGLDSTAVLALTRKVLGPSAEIRTFSIGFDDPQYDESSLARRTADLFSATHTEWRMSADEGQAEVAGYMAAMDQPSIDGFNTWCVSKLASRNGMKVVLSGLGGDELFGGYSSFERLPQFQRLYSSLGPLRRATAAALERAPAGSRLKRVAQFLRGPGTPLAAFNLQRGIFTEQEAIQLTRSITGIDPGPPSWDVQGLPRDAGDRVSFLELTRYMRNQLLGDSDVFSMAHGLELRVPFVDARLFDSVASIPSSIRLAKGKQLLIDAVPEIPEWVREQPKRGFRFPFQEWMSGAFGAALELADSETTVPLATWYRRWALAVVLQQREACIRA